MNQPLNRKLTLSAVQNIPPDTIRWDGQVKGFGAQGNRNGSVTFVMKTRVLGRQRWITIGKLGSPWTVETARAEALRILAEAAAGRDADETFKERRVQTTTFDVAVSDFLSQHGVKLKPRTRSAYEALVALHLKPAFSGKVVANITYSDVAAFHSARADIPRQANYAVAVLSKFMSWAEDQDLRAQESNPCRRIERYKERKRKRYLSPEEFQRLGQVLTEADGDGETNLFVLAAIRLLILTGARLSEILTLKWAYLDTYRRVLALPDSKTGEKFIPLNQMAIDVLAKLPRLNSNPYVLIGHNEGRHLINLQKPWQKLRHRAGLDDVRLHDLRHSFASVGISVGGSLPVIG
ncbi:MAG: site-specific integrase, partial [Chitinophagales bacterium]|nr:site-specific integrase [Hyphomicrobiales bacterium]